MTRTTLPMLFLSAALAIGAALSPAQAQQAQGEQVAQGARVMGKVAITVSCSDGRALISFQNQSRVRIENAVLSARNVASGDILQRRLTLKENQMASFRLHPDVSVGQIAGQLESPQLARAVAHSSTVNCQ